MVFRIEFSYRINHKYKAQNLDFGLIVKFFYLYLVKTSYVSSVILATLSFIATEAFETYGLRDYYNHKAREFEGEHGYFDVHHPDKFPTQSVPLNFSQWTPLDSTHWLFRPMCCSKGLMLRNLTSDSMQNIQPLPQDQELNHFAMVDSSLFLVDSKMNVFKSDFPFDSLSTHLVSKDEPTWRSAAFCYHESTHRFIFCSVDEDPASRERSLYDYNLFQNRYANEPIFTFDADEVLAFLSDCQPRISEELRAGKLGSPRIYPNAMGVHPKTNDLYMLCSQDRLLIVFSQFGAIKDVTYLNKEHYSNPISISFESNGDLIITNQGEKSSEFVRISWNKLWQTMRGAREFSFVH